MRTISVAPAGRHGGRPGVPGLVDRDGLAAAAGRLAGRQPAARAPQPRRHAPPWSTSPTRRPLPCATCSWGAEPTRTAPPSCPTAAPASSATRRPARCPWSTSTTATKLRDITVGPPLSHPQDIVVDRAGRRAYVALSASDEVVVVDLRHWQVERTISVGRSVGLGTMPVSLASSPNGTRLFVAESGADELAVIRLPGRRADEARDWTLVGRIPTSDDPKAVAVAAAGDGRAAQLLYVAARGTGVGPNVAGPVPTDPYDPIFWAFNFLVPTTRRLQPRVGHHVPARMIVGRAGILALPSDREVRRLTPAAARSSARRTRRRPPRAPRCAPAAPSSTSSSSSARTAATTSCSATSAAATATPSWSSSARTSRPTCTRWSRASRSSTTSTPTPRRPSRGTSGRRRPRCRTTSTATGSTSTTAAGAPTTSAPTPSRSPATASSSTRPSASTSPTSTTVRASAATRPS